MESELDLARHWIAEARGRVLFLLGAGASKPSLPVSSDLTAIVLTALDERFAYFAAESRVPQLWRDVRPVVEAMDSNIEDVYQALETLTYQKSDPTRYWVTHFAEFASYDGSRADLARDAGVILHMIQREALKALDEAQEQAPLDHFESLLNSEKIGIVTLNYDLLLERAGALFNVPVSTGAEQWDGGSQWAFANGMVPLLKLHGSMTWRSSRPLNQESGNLVPAIGVFEVSGLNEAAPNGLMTPTVIFGSGPKNTPFSVFPALTHKMHDWLDEADLLIVIGYSFRDQHVDAAIYRWASLGANRRIVVIDPYPRRNIAQSDGVLGGLLWAMDAAYVPTDWNTDSAAKTLGLNRMIFLVGSVQKQLPALVTPMAPPDGD